MRKKYLFLGIVLCMIIAFINNKWTIVYALSQYGSSGDEVKQIQSKLKDWGYYSGNVDGIYGSRDL